MEIVIVRGTLLGLALALGAAPAAASATDPDFCADRPGLATGTCTVAADRIQLETSFAEWSLSSDQGVREEEWALLSTKLRYGLGPKTDLHVSIVPLVINQVREAGARESTQSLGDVGLALKHRFTSEEALVSIAAMPSITMPTDSSGWQAAILIPVEGGINSAASWTLTPEVAWNADADGGGHHPRFALSASVGLSLSSRWSIALDAQASRERDDGSTLEEVGVGLSAAVMATQNIQLDAEIDFGLTSDTPDVRVATGAAIRF